MPILQQMARHNYEEAQSRCRMSMLCRDCVQPLSYPLFTVYTHCRTCRSHLCLKMIYAFAWKEGWVKVGCASDPMQRAADGFWENSHPKELCGLLCPPHFQLLGLWEGTQEEEKALHEQ